MPLRVINRPYEDLERHLEDLRKREFYYLGEAVFTDGEEEPIDADAFGLCHLPYCHRLSRIAMLFADMFCKKAVMLDIQGASVYYIETDNAKSVLDCILPMANICPEIDQEQASRKEPEDRELHHLRAAQPTFLSLLRRKRLIRAGYCLWRSLNAYRQSEEIRYEADEVGEYLDVIEGYFDLDNGDEWDTFGMFDCSVNSPALQFRDMVKYYEAIRIMVQETQNKPEGEQASQMLERAKSKFRKLVSELRMEEPCCEPEIELALWHIHCRFSYGLSYGEAVDIYEALGKEMSAHKKTKPDCVQSDAYRLWEFHGTVMQEQLVQIRSKLKDCMQQEQISWGDYLV